MRRPGKAVARASYEVRVTGLLGPVMVSALPADAAIHVPPLTRVVVDLQGRDLVEVLGALVGAGLQLDSVRLASGRDPQMRRSHGAAAVTREG